MEDAALSGIIARNQVADGVVNNSVDKSLAFLTDTAVDMGTAIWNSVVDIPSFFLPKSLEPDTSGVKLDTYDVLNRFNKDYASFFEENKAAIETASFIAGTILPGGAVLKGTKLLRSGRFAFYPEALTTTRAEKDLSTLSRMLEEGKQTTREFRSLRRNMYVRMAGSEFVDAVALETALVGTMSDHPFMEDYMKDPWTNFAIWGAAGGALGAGVGAIVKNAEIAGRLKQTYTDAQQVITNPSLIKEVNIPSLPAADLANRNFYNAATLQNIAQDTKYNDLTRQFAARSALRYQAAGESLLTDAIGADVKAASGLTKEQQRSLVEQVQQVLKADGSQGIDRVHFMDLQKVQATALTKKVVPEAESSAIKQLTERFGHLARYTANSIKLAEYLPDYPKLLENLKTSTYVGYSPVYKSYVPRSVAWTMQTAADIGQGAKAIDVFTPNYEAANIYLREGDVGNPAYVHQRYIDALKSVADAKIDTLPKQIGMHADDLPVMNAWVSRANDIVNANKDIVFRITPGKGLKSQDMDITQLADFLSRQKEKAIIDLTRAGASVHEMSTRLDMPQEILEAYLKERTPIDFFTNWRKTVDPAAIQEYLSPKNRMLKMVVDPNKRNPLVGYKASDAAVNLDQKTMDVLHRQFMEEIVQRHQSTTAQSIYEALDSKKELFDILRQRIGEINEESVGNMFTSSVDQALRRLDDLGTIITQTSKDVYNVNNKVFEQMAGGLSALTRQINDNAVYRQEFAEIVNALAGVPGYRYMDELGNFFVKEPVLNAEGAVIRGKFNDRPIMSLQGKPVVATSPVVRSWMDEMQKVGKENLALNNTLRAIEGNNPLNDIGLWIPAFNPVNKFISYIIDSTAPIGRQVKLLVGKDRNHLASLESAWKKEVGVNNPQLKLITKDEQADYNAIQNRLDPISMDYADISLRHSGASQQAIIPDAEELLATVMENLHHRFLTGTRKLVAAYNADIMHQLDMISTVNRRNESAATLKGITRVIKRAPDAAMKVKSVLLGESTIAQNATWQTFNNSVKTVLEKTIDTTASLFQKHLDFDKLGAMKKKDFIKLYQDMETAGLRNPFKTYDEYLAMRGTQATQPIDSLYAQSLKAKLDGRRSNADSIIATANAITATLALRVADLAHPLVNALSLPILTNMELMSRMPATFLGIKVADKDTAGVKFASRIIYDGVRARFNPALKSVVKEFEDEGFIKPIVSEASEVLRLVHSGESNATAKINKIIDSGLVKDLSKAADTVEVETRAVSLMTGYLAAKRAYPGITHEGAKLFAKQFMDRVIGNYHSFQRPTMFQGTFGVAIGLFQTYMLSMAQSIYRTIENRQFKALAGGMLTQAGMFGMSSLPFYDLVSKTIGEHMSDEHYDLTTGVYRALPDPLAEFIMYGLPSSIGSVVGAGLGIESLSKAKGVALYTRGDLQPRLPFFSSNPVDQLVAVNALSRVYQAAAHTIDKIANAEGAEQMGQALLEGLSMQNLSRPLARGAEVIAGYSVSQLGNTIQGPEDIWTFTGLAARVLSSRTTEEQIKRYADHLNSYYGAIDYENRRDAVESIKTAIRAGNLTDTLLSRIAYEYMRTGTPAGWRAALNEAIAGTEGGIDYKFTKVLKPNSPLNLMISNL